MHMCIFALTRIRMRRCMCTCMCMPYAVCRMPYAYADVEEPDHKLKTTHRSSKWSQSSEGMQPIRNSGSAAKGRGPHRHQCVTGYSVQYIPMGTTIIGQNTLWLWIPRSVSIPWCPLVSLGAPWPWCIPYCPLAFLMSAQKIAKTTFMCSTAWQPFKTWLDITWLRIQSLFWNSSAPYSHLDVNTLVCLTGLSDLPDAIWKKNKCNSTDVVKHDFFFQTNI